MGAIKACAFEIFDADGALLVIEQHSRRQSVEFETQFVGMLSRHLD